MKDIVKKAGENAKLRLRGKGSGFVEHSTNKESEEPLQLCISCQDSYGYDTAVQSVDSLLRRIYMEYDKFCAERGLPHRAPALKMRERRASERGAEPFEPRGDAGKKNRRKQKKAANCGAIVWCQYCLLRIGSMSLRRLVRTRTQI
jgi:hypothetical protein